MGYKYWVSEQLVNHATLTACKHNFVKNLNGNPTLAHDSLETCKGHAEKSCTLFWASVWKSASNTIRSYFVNGKDLSLRNGHYMIDHSAIAFLSALKQTWVHLKAYSCLCLCNCLLRALKVNCYCREYSMFESDLIMQGFNLSTSSKLCCGTQL